MNSSEEFKVGKHSIGFVNSSFIERFEEQDFEAVTTPPRAIRLPQYMNNAQIESELKPGLCTLGDVLAVLDSTDLTYRDGNWNLFYFPSCVVSVCWDSWGGSWGVSAWHRDGGVWNEGDRVFSPASDRLEHSVPSGLSLESLDARLKKIERIINPELLK